MLGYKGDEAFHWHSVALQFSNFIQVFSNFIQFHLYKFGQDFEIPLMVIFHSEFQIFIF